MAWDVYPHLELLNPCSMWESATGLSLPLNLPTSLLRWDLFLLRYFQLRGVSYRREDETCVEHSLALLSPWKLPDFWQMSFFAEILKNTQNF